jgi:acetate kinase
MIDGTVFVLNAGSSSLKYQLVDPASGEVHAGGLIERIGEEGGVPDHEAAVRAALDDIEGLPEPVACGHRVVHGGSLFDAATVVTPEVEQAIQDLSALAPLHNPANLEGIRAAEAVLDVPQVAVFDTAFHRTMPRRTRSPPTWPASTRSAGTASTARRTSTSPVRRPPSSTSRWRRRASSRCTWATGRPRARCGTAGPSTPRWA